MRDHIACGLQHTMDVLTPYFPLRKASGKTFFRSQRKHIEELQDFKIAADVK